MVKAVAHLALMAKLEAAEQRIRKLEAEAFVQGQLMHELIAETSATSEQITAAALRACGISPQSERAGA